MFVVTISEGRVYAQEVPEGARFHLGDGAEIIATEAAVRAAYPDAIFGTQADDAGPP